MTPRAPSSPCSSSSTTVRSKFSSTRGGVATSNLPRSDDHAMGPIIPQVRPARAQAPGRRGQLVGERLGVHDHQLLHGSGQRDVEQPGPTAAAGQERRRLDDDDGVELEALGLGCGEHAQAVDASASRALDGVERQPVGGADHRDRRVTAQRARAHERCCGGRDRRRPRPARTGPGAASTAPIGTRRRPHRWPGGGGWRGRGSGRAPGSRPRARPGDAAWGEPRSAIDVVPAAAGRPGRWPGPGRPARSSTGSGCSAGPASATPSARGPGPRPPRGGRSGGAGSRARPRPRRPARRRPRSTARRRSRALPPCAAGGAARRRRAARRRGGPGTPGWSGAGARASAPVVAGQIRSMTRRSSALVRTASTQLVLDLQALRAPVQQPLVARRVTSHDAEALARRRDGPPVGRAQALERASSTSAGVEADRAEPGPGRRRLASSGLDPVPRRPAHELDHPRVALQRGDLVGVDALHVDRAEAGHGGLDDRRLAERGQHLGDVAQERAGSGRR